MRVTAPVAAARNQRLPLARCFRVQIADGDGFALPTVVLPIIGVLERSLRDGAPHLFPGITRLGERPRQRRIDYEQECALASAGRYAGLADPASEKVDAFGEPDGIQWS